ncbi:MAG: hypothetical protein ACJAXS_002487 [Colwellia sp.]|jgi:hypothetical protein
MKAVSHQHLEKIQTVKVCYAPNHLRQKLHFNFAYFTGVAIAASKITKQMNNQVHKPWLILIYIEKYNLSD